ncbi:hypothetical protein SAMN02799624_05356 [Paenibacillus sp. UNC496MF]|uniref:hypothetical protein n=1 Tax=Paenibacillus sp. UNC496MF TaxID=1502753 RepID=UPI0008E0B7CA|nr:hypothetical protein [Paenibacillus sp. UNC496MF]SFJ64685.1 hypothetical protein SAMN02799624_05356 [Paenibacillus sp. UNC496MF]
MRPLLDLNEPVKLTMNLMEIGEYQKVMQEAIQSWIGKPVLNPERTQVIGTIELVWIEDNMVKANVTIDRAAHNQHFTQWVAGCMQSFVVGP